MADTKQQKSDDGPTGAPPQADQDMNAPGMTNGVPDQAGDAEATGTPASDRKATETAVTSDGSDG